MKKTTKDKKIQTEPEAHAGKKNEIEVSLEELQNLADNIPSGIGIFRAYNDGRIEQLYINDGFYSMLHTTREERTSFTGFQTLNSVYEPDKEKIRKEVVAAIKEKRQVNVEYRVLNGSGEYQWINVRGTIVQQNEDQCMVYISYSDIDELKKMQLNLEKNQIAVEMTKQRLQQELFRNYEIYYQSNLTKRVVTEYADQVNEHQLETPFPITDDVITKIILEKVEPKYRDIVEREMFPVALEEKYRQGITSTSLIYRRQMTDGKYCWVRGSATMMMNPETNDLLSLVYIQDIDKEKKRELAVNSVVNEEIESIILYQLHDDMLDIVLEEDIDELRKVQTVIPMQKRFIDILLKDVIEEDQKACRDFLKKECLIENLKQQNVLQIIFLTEDEYGICHRKKVRAMYLDEDRDAIVFARRDITDLYEEEQRQKRQLENAIDEANTANQAKSKFLSQMSHDMRTPLNAILSLSGKELRENITKDQTEEYLDKIHSSGEYLLGIINDVLDMSKIESQKMVLQQEMYTLEEFVENIQTIIGEQCREKGLFFDIDHSAVVLDTILVDKIRFNQIFINLLSNAVKFTPPGGKVELVIEHIRTEGNKAYKRFIVRDNGIGMSGEFLPHIYESFTQENLLGTEMNAQGTGLGLSIVKQLVELMHGKISVESKLEEGTTFVVELEIAVGENNIGRVEKTVKTLDLKGTHILLCEDHPLNIQIAKMLLEKKECIVDVAENGKLGYEKFMASREGSYDLILMDIRMPIMDGFEATKKIRNANRSDAKTIPIIAMTANAFEEDVQMSREAGMNDHLSKPIDTKRMYHVIASYIQQMG